MFGWACEKCPLYRVAGCQLFRCCLGLKWIVQSVYLILYFMSVIGVWRPSALFAMYRIAGNFRGRKLSRIVGKYDFHKKTFADCLLVQPTDTTPPKFSKARVSALLALLCLL